MFTIINKYINLQKGKAIIPIIVYSVIWQSLILYNNVISIDNQLYKDCSCNAQTTVASADWINQLDLGINKSETKNINELLEFKHNIPVDNFIPDKTSFDKTNEINFIGNEEFVIVDFISSKLLHPRSPPIFTLV